MSDANQFLLEFEARFRGLARSVDMYRMRPENNDLLVSFTQENDFLATVRASSSANIAVEVGWLFHGAGEADIDIGRCFLRFQLSNKCLDERLTTFLDDLSLRVPLNPQL
jgi:hypothetical protein